MKTYLSARRAATVYDGTTSSAVRHLPDATAVVLAAMILAYVLP